MLFFNSLAGTTVLSETSHGENVVSSFLYLSLVNRRSRWLVLMFVSSRFRPPVFQFTSYVRYGNFYVKTLRARCENWNWCKRARTTTFPYRCLIAYYGNPSTLSKRERACTLCCSPLFHDFPAIRRTKQKILLVHWLFFLIYLMVVCWVTCQSLNGMNKRASK